MPRIPVRILKNIRCTLCRGYLTSKPLMARPPDQQICGKCYKILPALEQRKCARQVALESVLELYTFPCRFDFRGCSHEFNWGEGEVHEAECPHRGLLDSHGEADVIQEPVSEIQCETEQLRAVFEYDIEENRYSNVVKRLRYSLLIRGIGGNVLTIRNNRNSGAVNESSNVELKLIGSIFLGSKPEVIYNDIEVRSLQTDNIYQTMDKHCSQCRSLLEGSSTSYCLQGHPSCFNCKDKMCAQCVRNLENKSKSLCKNFRRGCMVSPQQDEVHQHQVDCVFKDLHCPLQPCSLLGAKIQIQQHLMTDHTNRVISDNEFINNFSNKDNTVVLLCYDSIFKCVYYYYRTFVDIFVTHIGPSSESKRFTFEVRVKNGEFRLLRRGQCSSWNDMMLQKGVTIEKRDMLNKSDEKLDLDIQIRILNDELKE